MTGRAKISPGLMKGRSGYFVRSASHCRRVGIVPVRWPATTLEAEDAVRKGNRRGTVLGFTIVRGYAVVQYDDMRTEVPEHPADLERTR